MKRLFIKLISDTHLSPVVSPFDETPKSSHEKMTITAEQVIKKLENDDHPQEENTILILAGDIGDVSSDSYRRILTAARKSYKNVLLVPGNHEYYTDGARDMSVVKMQLERLSRDLGIILLDNSEVLIKGVRFIGSTCWPLVPEEQIKVLKREGYGLVTRITKNSHRLDSADFKRLHDEDISFLQRTVDMSKEPCVIVTHYPPEKMMLDDRFEHSPHLALHYNDGLVAKIAKTQGRTPLWCCGHCHTGKKYWVHGMNTLLVANCVEGEQYDPDFIIEVLGH